MESENKSEKIKRSTRGGARKGAGRPKGSTQKVSAITLLEAIAKADKPFEEGLAEDYVKARQSGDLHLAHKYQNMILNKVVADKQEVDLTSAGKAIGVAFTFTPTETDDWK